MSNTLVIDLGTQSMRGTVFDEHGDKRWSASSPVDSDIDGDRYEQDPAQWSAIMDDLLRQSEAHAPAEIVVSAPLAGLVCIEESGRVLGQAITYADRRSAKYVDVVDRCRAFDPVRRETGFRPYISDPLPQTLWLQHEQSSAYNSAKHILDATGYLNWRLTGEATMDCYTALRCYSDEVIAELGLDRSKFGQPTKLGEVIGAYHDIPVIAATYDSKCAYVGSGIAEPGEALDISGTVTSFGVVAERRVMDAQRRIYSVPLGDKWMVRGSTAMSGGILEWARRELVGGSFDDFDALVQASEPGAGGVVFLPYLAGERAPLWNPHARGAFHGMTLSTGRAELARAVYEGLCFALRHITSVIGEHGVAIDSVRLAGGLSRNDTLNQIKADVLGVPCHALEDYELTSLGAARIANKAIGPPRTARTFTPGAARHENYNTCFDAYRALVDRLSNPPAIWGGTHTKSEV